MASGSTVTMTGGTDMTQVVASTDNILDTDFNNMRTNVNLMMSGAADATLSAGGSFTFANAYGYGQGGVGVNAASDGDLVRADNATGGFKRLQDDVQALCAFLGQSVRSGVGSDVSAGDSVTATTWNNTMLNIKDCWDNRFTPAATSTSTSATKTYTSQWNTTLTQETTFTFSNEGDCRRFFNGGGGIGFSSTRAGGSSTTQNTNWTNTLSAMGDALLIHNTGTGSSGSASGIGFYELATSYQDVFTKFGSGAYASNFFKLQAKVNSVTNPTVITCKATYSDPHAEGAGALGPDGIASTGDEAFGNDFIDGTMTLNARTKAPSASGSGFTFDSPTVSMGNISGT